MKCVICKHGTTKPGQGSLLFEHEGKKYYVSNIPARVCTNCGEEYFDNQVLAGLRNSFADVTMPIASIETRNYIAAPNQP